MQVLDVPRTVDVLDAFRVEVASVMRQCGYSPANRPRPLSSTWQPDDESRWVTVKYDVTREGEAVGSGHAVVLQWSLSAAQHATTDTLSRSLGELRGAVPLGTVGGDGERPQATPDWSLPKEAMAALALATGSFRSQALAFLAQVAQRSEALTTAGARRREPVSPSASA